ncbi:hypothetical protein JAAARDRAFT_28049 [Jaapia argillacea MUCL 33604]|uniref:phosphatidate phosphatase n=1 Tax=Jaapia argillacea MUCL 33604 TaxID=933084 RepID=A0A067QBU9_9AGAM|nr:hypothetical protein JAAARDRAFT_28049 [Jaapia argillacea MUCL 33604]
MNYLRGAVSAISAPYQYYKDLPPINPATLTGAIDVIVIKRPTPNGDFEYVCSPFHVRFGKWQVLRPQDKKVNVLVNGHPIPFHMKIGDAGEAFFVFETESEVPEDLITSPLLEATLPGESNAAAVKSGRFGAMQKAGDDDVEEQKLDDGQEPEPLDLNAQTPPAESSGGEVTAPHSQPTSTPAATQFVASPSSMLSRTKAAVTAVLETERDNIQHITDTVAAANNAAKNESIKDLGRNVMKEAYDLGDEALPLVKEEDAKPADVIYKKDIVIDAAGYSSHDRERSDNTVVASNGEGSSPSPSPSPNRTPEASRSPSPEPGPSSSRAGGSPIPFPSVRATSAPPPDMESEISAPIPKKPGMNGSLKGLSVSPDEYSWDWGGFPQRSPMNTNFPVGVGPAGVDIPRPAARKGKERMSDLGLGMYDEEDESPRERVDSLRSVDLQRSSSVPPGVGGSPRANRKELSEEGEVDHQPRQSSTRRSLDKELSVFGSGGRLSARPDDSTKFGVEFYDGGTLEFELSIVGSGQGDDERWHKDEIEFARRFEEGKVGFERFLDDEGIVKSEGLVLKWVDDRFIRRQDGSPLMDALVVWRESALRERIRSLTPTMNRRGESMDLRMDDRTQTMPASNTARKSTWMSWWGRSRSSSVVKEEAGGKGGRPIIREANSAPSQAGSVVEPLSKGLPNRGIPRPHSISEPPTPPPEENMPGSDVNASLDAPRKFAKTLRLTSDQLKELDLKAGPNTITFSLSSSGVAACTARIFVWDHEDSVVISDIDGTITKSDALGHVFAMVGRDWTHLGVAKLYTDICRNGYKVLYLTSRAIGQADATRYYLKGIKQNDYQLPEGPVIMSPDRLFASLHREVIMRKPEMFKMACLRDVQRLFGGGRNPFYAGFGNRITDALSYRSVNVPSSRIFTIDSNGEVKMELLELAGYKSSYIHMTDLVDQMFPPIHRKWAPEYTDFNYWKPPMAEYPLPDLTPPSPALSARSDTSNQSTLARLRNFSLGGRQSTIKPSGLPLRATENGPERSSTLKQMSSFERLSSALGSFTRSSSPTPSNGRRSASPSSSSGYLDSGSEDEDDGDLESQKRRRRRGRTRSMESMPGSLPGSVDDIHFGMEEQHEDEEYDEEEGDEEEEEAEEAAFDEDLLATGEMESVPFL